LCNRSDVRCKLTSILNKQSPNNNGRNPNTRIWNARVLLRYWLLQLPATGLLILILVLLRDRLSIPDWVLWSIVAIWVAKDALLYPLVWRSYDVAYPVTAHSLEGAHGVATERIDSTGHVRVRGELWRAELTAGAPPIDKGEHVLVETRRDLILLVRPRDK
jgi:membrane protein implicated in regulation of membrane protease activity